MKVRTYKSFKEVNRRLDEIALLLAALVEEQSDEAETKALAAEVRKRTEKLKAALPPTPAAPPPGNPTPL